MLGTASPQADLAFLTHIYILHRECSQFVIFSLEQSLQVSHGYMRLCNPSLQNLREKIENLKLYEEKTNLKDLRSCLEK